MSDTLGFSVEGLGDDASKFHKYYGDYSSALASFKANVDSLSTKWTGDESGVVQAFINSYNNKKAKLEMAESLMSTLSAELKGKYTDFDAAAEAARNAFN